MKKVINITSAKHNLLKIITELEGEVIITRDYRPVAVLSPLPGNAVHKKPALIVLAARQCEPPTMKYSLSAINASAGLFGKMVVVYSRETASYLGGFSHHNLLAIETAKKQHPIVTSLKAGISCLDENDAFFMFSFINKPVRTEIFRRLTAAIGKAEDNKKGIIIPVSGGKPAHPLIFSTRYKANIIKIRKELGIPHIIKRHQDDVFYVDIGT
jgi:CTP:molybdopterin cytidylyltransferase MocA